MTNQKDKTDSFEKKMKTLSCEDQDKILEEFKKRIHQEFAAYLNTCAHCGLCADSCHYYLTSQEHENIPAYKLSLVTQIFKDTFDSFGRRFPLFFGAASLNKKKLREWIDVLFGRCSLCGRCTINCTMGINIPYLIRAARGALASAGLVPPGLQSTVDTAVDKGNNMGISKDDWLETIEWLEDELREETGDQNAELPVDQKGARLLYTINPREAMFFPLSISAVGKIFYAAQESWTFSSDNFDVTNYGLYSGDNSKAGLMSERLIKSLNHLQCSELILAECGHGFNSNRWEAPEWLKLNYQFEVKSILEVIWNYIQEGQIKLDSTKNPDPVTLHDPCNLVRLGGIIECQRDIIRNSVQNFIEMSPNREKNYCCGGGGGQLAMTRYAERRIKAGELKAQQIKETGAKIVATPCHNCIDQLMELNKHYQLGVEIKTVSEIVADAVVLE
ncbi:MAG: (Fe-S)-binding protein [Candidatus Aminicenantes bacterium]|nr:(Fe-S)-binding protein [Candidatus Aminicenantes bacterium]